MQRLGDQVADLEFQDDVMDVPALSLSHARRWHEMTIGPLAKIVAPHPNSAGRVLPAGFTELLRRQDEVPAAVSMSDLKR